MSTKQAFARLVRDLPVTVVPSGDQTWRIRATAAPVVHLAPAALPASGEIVVTASKTGADDDRYAGTVSMVDGGTLDAASARMGSAALVEKLPALNQTQLGSGRNKLFIRGVADSSFNGPSQATVGEYLGDVRLTYNAPDPDLSLYDVRSVEVLEGPQGTLYGVGTLGGVVRVITNPVDLTRDSLDLAVGVSAPSTGAGGHDVVGVVNLAFAPNAGMRVLLFDTRLGGYISDPSRGMRNVNGTGKRGGRLRVRLETGAWAIEVGGLVQNVSTHDGQYADAMLPPLKRTNRIAQPFDNDYVMAFATVSRDASNGAGLVSATGLVRQTATSRFDYTPAGAALPRAFDQANRIWLVSNETRLSRRDADGRGWVAGLSLLHDQESLTRGLGPPPDPPRILGVRNSITQAAMFGEAGFAMTPALLATLGGRLEFTEQSGEPLGRKADNDEPRRHQVAVLPSIALGWRPSRGLEGFVRYQEGYRPGGLSVDSDQGSTVRRFHGDSLASMEAGLKAHRRLWDVELTLSHARWHGIQADLVNAAGLPFTATIGSGELWAAEARARWTPVESLRLGTGIFVNDSNLTKPSPDYVASRGEDLPNTAHVGISGTADYRQPLGQRWQFDGNLTVRYVGHSRLGIDTLHILQGNYTLARASGRLGTQRWGVSVSVDNALNSRGSIFALGNPFNVGAGTQIVPPRPRTVRAGLDAHF